MNKSIFVAFVTALFLCCATVPTAILADENAHSEIYSYGLALPKHSVTLRSSVESNVSRILVREGQWVRKGDVLVELAGAAAIAKRKIAKLAASETGSMMNAAAELKYANDSFNRISALRDKKAINEKEYNDSLLRFESAKAKLQIEHEVAANKEARFELASAELNDFFLTAPFDGQISALNVDLGNPVTSSTDILQIISSNDLKVELYVPLKDAKNLMEGEICRLRIQEPYDETTCDATVMFRSPVIEATTNSIRIVMEIDNRKLRLPAGVTVSLD